MVRLALEGFEMIRLFKLLPAVFIVIGASVQATTIVATPTSPYTVPPFQFYPTFTIAYTDRNQDGLFEINELDSFTANSTIAGSGGGIYGTVYTALFSTPDIQGVSASSILQPNPAPSNSGCATGWCMSTLTYRIASTDPTVLSSYSRFLVTDYTYVVSETPPVPEASSYMLSAFGLLVLAATTFRRRAQRH